MQLLVDHTMRFEWGHLKHAKIIQTLDLDLDKKSRNVKKGKQQQKGQPRTQEHKKVTQW